MGQQVELRVQATEPLAGPPVMNVSGAARSPELVEEGPERLYLFVYEVTGREAGLVQVRGVDLAGNPGEASFAAGFDFDPPPTPRAALIEVLERPPGQQDELVGHPGAAGGDAVRVRLLDEEGEPLGSEAEVQAQGSFGPLPFGDNAHDRVSVQALDAAGNASLPAGPFPNDRVAPQLLDLLVQPLFARHGTVVEASGRASEPLRELSASLDGRPASCDLDPAGALLFRCHVEVDEAQDPAGTVELRVDAIDLAQNPASATAELTLDYGFDAPGVTVLALQPPPGPDGIVWLSRLSLLRIDLELAEAPGRTPEARAAGHPMELRQAEGGGWRYAATYQPSGAEPQERELDAIVSAWDRAGNAAPQARVPLRFDFQAPGFLPPRLDPPLVGSPLIGQQVALVLESDEPLIASPSLELPGGEPPQLVEPDEGDPATTFRYALHVTGRERGTLRVRGADLAGNEGRAEHDLAFDFDPPRRPREALLELTQVAPGPPEGPECPDLLEGVAGALPPDAAAARVYYALPPGPEVLVAEQELPAQHDGSFGPLEVGDNDHRELFVLAVDAAGNESDPAGPIFNDIDPPRLTLDPENPAAARRGDLLELRVFVEDASEVPELGLSIAGRDADLLARPPGMAVLRFEVQGRDGEGSVPVEVWAVDAAGNLAEQAQGEAGSVELETALMLERVEGKAATTTRVAETDGSPVRREAGQRCRVHRFLARDAEPVMVSVTAYGWNPHVSLTEDAVMGEARVLAGGDRDMVGVRWRCWRDGDRGSS